MSDWSNFQAPQPTPVQAGPDRDTLIQQWKAACNNLARMKEAELNLRNAVIGACFPGAGEGTATIELGNGYKLKHVGKLNYTLDKDNAKVEGALDQIERTGDEGKFLADRVIRWKPELSVTEYRDLPANVRAIVDTVLTIKPGQSSLELVEPKAKK